MNNNKEISTFALFVGITLLGIILVVFCCEDTSLPIKASGHIKRSSGVLEASHGTFFNSKPIQPAPILYQVKKFKRNGKNYMYVTEQGEKSNLNQDKNHPTRTPLCVSPDN